MHAFCLLVLGGEIRDAALFRRRLDEAGQVLAADSGAGHLLRCGVMPEQVYGDMDSLTAEEIRQLEEGGCRFVVSPAEKNDTDGGIVLKEALRRGYGDIRIWGALGGRPDHAYANLMLLQLPQMALAPAAAPESAVGLAASVETRAVADAAPEPAPATAPKVTIEDGGLRIFLPRRGEWIEGKAGDGLSLFALTPEVTGFKQTGLKYQPEGGRFVSGFPLGVSNEFIQGRVLLDWDAGTLLCMVVEKV